MMLADETIRLLDANGDIFYLPEALRVRGGIALTGPRPDPDEAEALFRRSLDLSRRQGARAWELRTAIDLSALLAARGWSVGLTVPGHFCSRCSSNLRRDWIPLIRRPRRACWEHWSSNQVGVENATGRRCRTGIDWP